ncbi:hypothetical protein MFLAVUS_001175 [Mucor flavus]|uniref:Protein Lines N-terminal domain-containing protein n=1 Tax=Mucor flavus TaxID=439312 RepID=A0ABP9YLR8_9FUNG
MKDFITYHENYSLYQKVIHHEKSAIDQCNQRIIQASKVPTDHELDFYHWILKHVRACEESQCYQLGQAIQDVILHILSSQPQINSCSLLVCMIDLVKNDNQLDKNTLHQFISLTCHLWQHKKIYMCRKSIELCKRILPSLPEAAVILPQVVQYIVTCQTVLTRQDIAQMQSPEYTDFFYNSPGCFTFDRECIKLMIQIVLSLFLYHPQHELVLLTAMKDVHDLDLLELKTMLFDICCANDDDTIQLLNTILTLFQQASSTITDFLQSIDITPHTLFLFFLSRCGNTHDIIIDLLLEDDSDFLSYFYRYIKYANQGHLHPLLKQEQFLTILANTVLVLEGDGLPYNPKPLVKQLVQLEETLYNLR